MGIVAANLIITNYLDWANTVNSIITITSEMLNNSIY